MSNEIGELAKALAKAQKQIKGAVKDSANPFFKSNYADLASVWDAIREPLSTNGLSVVQSSEIVEGDSVRCFLVTILMHESGQWITGEYLINPTKNDPQAWGSATSYARRYALAAMVGVFQIDDDAESAMTRQMLPNGQIAKPIHPEQPAPGDGVQTDEYVIPYGKHAKKPISKVNPAELRDYIIEIEEKARQTQKLPVWATELFKHAEPIIAKWENEKNG